jgi:RNA 2',3'-cyclic 3'-phosphodiesterase
MTSTASVEGHERPRLFVALRLPGDVVERLVAWQAQLPRSDARLVPPENLHMTVAFLGARPATDVEPILGELRAAAAAAGPMAFEVRDYRETRSVGMVRFEDEGGRAEAFAGDVSARLAALGVYRPEQRRWLPHVTVLRFRSQPRLRPEPPALGRVSPSDAALYHSVLRPSGAQYSVIERAALGG